MKKTMRGMTGALLACSASAVAHEPEPDGVRPGWYVAPMYALIQFDASRKSPDGDGYAVAVGHRGTGSWDWLTLEARGEFLESLAYTDRYFVPGQNPGDPPQERRRMGEHALAGGVVTLLVEPLLGLESPWLRHVYTGLGAGAIKFDARQPSVPANERGRLRQDEKHFPLEAGLGWLYPFKVFGFGMAARVQATYRVELEPDDPASEPEPQDRYEDLLYHAGLQIPLSATPPEPAAAPAPVAVVEIADADNDGVPDPNDRCPGTPAGSLVNNVGCVPEAPGPVTLETAKPGDTIVLHGVTFEFNRATLTVNARTLLDSLAKELGKRPELRVEVGGHTDARGSDAYNQSLSEMRAQSVQTYLTEQGVAAERLSAKGYGEAQPVDSNETDEGRERNRRVELKILDREAQ